MGARISPGFTIIETVLFLAVTGLLVMGVLIGTGSALNKQRYQDSIETFKNTIQSQYADLGSVRNSRDNNWDCDALAQTTMGGSQIRGQSDCFIVGKLMRIDATNMTTYTVLATEKASLTGNDIEKLDTNYNYAVSTTETDIRKMEWGTQLAWPVSGTSSKSPSTPRAIDILFIRSPDSGSIYTFSKDVTPGDDEVSQTTFTDIIKAGTASFPGQGARRLCVQSTGLFPSGESSIYINSFASSASAVEVQSNEFMAAQGITTRC